MLLKVGKDLQTLQSHSVHLEQIMSGPPSDINITLATCSSLPITPGIPGGNTSVFILESTYMYAQP